MITYLSLYVVSACVCLVFAGTRAFHAVRDDLRRRRSDVSYYSPAMTWGVLLGMLLCAALPLVNTIWTIYVVLRWLAFVIEKILIFFDRPIVPQRR